MDNHLSFLVDVNLPKYFSFFNNADFIFVSDINLQMTDTEIWNYALENNCFLVSEKTPKVIFFQLGNYSLKQLYDYFNANWDKLKTEIGSFKLIIAKKTHIESIR